MTHRSEVHYFTSDDGIWLVCHVDDKAHWEIGLGFFPSVDQVMEAWAKHLREEGDDEQG